MLLLTGATGLVGSNLLRRLLAEGTQVRCLVRDPRRLGTQRVRVQIALGDLTDPPSFRNALRGVDTVVHLAAAIRDQPAGVDRGARRDRHLADGRGGASAREWSASSSSPRSAPPPTTAPAACARRRTPSRPSREADLHSIVFAPSIVYAPGDAWLTLLERMALLPVMPMSGRGRARFQPIWAEDVADCIVAALRGSAGGSSARYELAGPETLSHAEIIRTVLRRAGPQPADRCRVPTPVVSRGLRTLERAMGPRAFATWDEAELMEVSMLSPRGSADVEALGVSPQRMSAVLEAA